MIIESFPDRVIHVNNQEYLYFGGTSYLGMATQLEFQNLICDNIKKWGTFYGSSREANVKLSVYNRVENLFAEQIKSEAAVIVSSGTLAGKIATEYLLKNIKASFYYPKSHPAILTQDSLPLFVDNKLHPKLLDNLVEDVIISADAILALEVTPTKFDFINQISSTKKITILLDESHSLGIIGNKGMGIFSSINKNKIHRIVMVSSLGKALGLSGGIIASDADFIDGLKKEALFISSSGANPAYLEAYLQAQNIYSVQQQKLKSNLSFFNSKFIPSKIFKYSANYPVIYCDDENISEIFLKNNIVIAYFKYPTYKKMMNRIVISANHTKADLEKLINILNTL